MHVPHFITAVVEFNRLTLIKHTEELQGYQGTVFRFNRNSIDKPIGKKVSFRHEIQKILDWAEAEESQERVIKVIWHLGSNPNKRSIKQDYVLIFISEPASRKLEVLIKRMTE